MNCKWSNWLQRVLFSLFLDLCMNSYVPRYSLLSLVSLRSIRLPSLSHFQHPVLQTQVRSRRKFCFVLFYPHLTLYELILYMFLLPCADHKWTNTNRPTWQVLQIVLWWHCRLPWSQTVVIAFMFQCGKESVAVVKLQTFRWIWSDSVLSGKQPIK